MMAARLTVALIAGLIFGFGLALSGMLDPARVRGFLDITGDFDPSLIFVLGGAVLVASIGTLLQRRMARPVLDDRFHMPARTRIDRPLVIGSAIFGIGWGIAGFCPGPALASLTTGLPAAGLFVVSMAVGFFIHDKFLLPFKK